MIYWSFIMRSRNSSSATARSCDQGVRNAISRLLIWVSLVSLFQLAFCDSVWDRRKGSRLLLDIRNTNAILRQQRDIAWPSAFDSSIGTNFTSDSCPRFFASFLSDQNVQTCMPISLMLQNSASFFEATKSPTNLGSVLDYSCSISLPKCNSIMQSYATKLLSSSACGQDYSARNPIVVQAYNGFMAYPEVRQAACMQNTDKTEIHESRQKYCFANAILNASSPTNSYIYYLPLGVGLPPNTSPTCDSCLQRTMNGYAEFAANSLQPISAIYPDAATQINNVCGQNFAQIHVKITSGSSHGRTVPSSGVCVAAAFTLLLILLLS